MKKTWGILIALVVLLVAVVGCSSAEAENKDLTLDKFIEAYQDEGIEVDPAEKPIFQMIEAKDGVIFYVDKQKVAIYEYASNKDAKKAKSDAGDMMKDWHISGSFLLETSNEKAIQIFESVK